MLFNSLFVALGGALGALFRYLIVSFSQLLIGPKFPYGTLIVNSSGSLLIGFIFTIFMERLFLTEPMRLLIIVGFLGGFTTFSSFAWETWSLYQNGQWMAALLNICLNNCLGLCMLVFGVILGRSY